MELKDIIHFYLGCPVWICKNIEGADVIEPLTRKMLYEDIDQGDMFFDPEDLLPHKLILRPLSTITEDEALELGRMLIYANGKNCRAYKTNKGYWRIQFGNISGQHWTIDGDVFNQLQTVFLLRQGFDIFNLIGTGQAIDATTLTQQQ